MVQVETQWADQTGIRLYGFLSSEERRTFVALQEIQGVGPKAALAVLDVLAPGELMAAAHRGDKAIVARASGVGPKLALAHRHRAEGQADRRRQRSPPSTPPRPRRRRRRRPARRSPP